MRTFVSTSAAMEIAKAPPALAISMSVISYIFESNMDACDSLIYLQDDVQDIRTVASYFEGKGYQIYAIIGHSRGTIPGQPP